MAAARRGTLAAEEHLTLLHADPDELRSAAAAEQLDEDPRTLTGDHAGGAARRRRDGRPSRGRRGLPSAGPELIALAALVLLAVESAVSIIPEQPTLGYLTPLRDVVIIGLLAALATSWRRRSWATAFDLPVILLVIAAFAAGWLNGRDLASWRWLLTYLGAFWLTVAVARRFARERESFSLIGLIGVALSSLIALQDSASGAATGFCRNPATGLGDCDDPDALMRAVGTFENPNTFAAFLVLLLPLAAAFALGVRGMVGRAMGWAVVAAGVIAVVLTLSRGPILALAIGAAAYWLLRKPTRARLRIGLAASGVGLVLFVIVAFAAPGASGVRSDVWRAAVSGALSHPLGVGLQRGGGVIQDTLGSPDEPFFHAHNLWLNMWLETGILGLAASLAITIIAAVAVVRISRAGDPLGPALGAALAGFAACSLVDNAANTTRVALALALVLGLVAAQYAAPTFTEALLGARDWAASLARRSRAADADAIGD